MLYTIVNPSDGYTIDCADLEIAAIACLLLGEGQYGLTAVEQDAEDVPIMLFGDPDNWFLQHFNQTMPDVMRHVREARTAELATALDSVVIGNDVENRTELQALLQPLPEAERAAKRAVWHNERRSSLNDIGSRAYAMAKILREEKPASMPRAPKQVFSS